jgi:hypothetical protein
METLSEAPKDFQFEKMKAQLSTLKPELMLEDSARNMLASLLINIDFRVCSDDLEILQLFFKRVYVGIEALKKERDELKKEIQILKERCVDEPASPVISESF